MINFSDHLVAKTVVQKRCGNNAEHEEDASLKKFKCSVVFEKVVNCRNHILT